jgi:hypothetical protein
LLQQRWDIAIAAIHTGADVVDAAVVDVRKLDSGMCDSPGVVTAARVNSFHRRFNTDLHSQ